MGATYLLYHTRMSILDIRYSTYTINMHLVNNISISGILKKFF